MDLEKVEKIDMACGNNKKDGFCGIDIDKYDNVDLVMDLRFKKLPFKDGQLSHVYASHFLEHLTFEENLYLFNEVYRCMKVGGIFEVVVPHGMSYAGMVDLSHKTFWTEDTFGYFTPENKYYYSWFFDVDGVRTPIINRWRVLSNDATPKYTYTKEGFLENKLREVHAFLEKI